MSLIHKKQKNIPRRRIAENNISNMNLDTRASDTFRRNRTIIGSTSNKLISTNTAKNDLESPRARAHRLTIIRRKILAAFFIAILSIILIFLLITNFTSKVIVSLSDTKITKVVDTAKYESAIQEYLDNNPTNRLTFLLNRSALLTYVIDKLPEISNISAPESAGIGTTNFTLTMRNPVAGWNINDKQYYVDSNGTPFEKNYFNDPAVQIVDESGITIDSSSTAIASKRFLSFVGKVVSLSKKDGYTVTQAVLPSGTARQLQIHLSGYNFYVKLSIDRSVGEQIEDMDKAIKYFNSKSQSPQYIDVRISGKAFYI